jgi:hypothetical protein
MRNRTFVLLVLLYAALADSSRAGDAVDLELVLAIDSSGSVDDGEWALQMHGYANAFRDPRIKGAIASGPSGRIGVAVIVWADASVPIWESPWFVLSAPADSERFASYIAELGRHAIGGTGIGAGVAAAVRKLDRNDLDAPRQVVDVSGDGRETPPRENVVLIPMANAMAWARGVTVNGIAILNEDPDLAVWYRDNVIAGQSAFVMTAADYADFTRAIVEKLTREIEHRPRLSRLTSP